MRAYLVVIAVSVMSAAGDRTPPAAVFSSLGLTAKEIGAIDAGRPVAKVLPWGESSEVYVFGAVHIDGSRETYLNAARDVRSLRDSPGYLAVGELAEGATVADLAALTFEPDDLEALKHCRDGTCDVQLPTASIQAFRDGVDFSAPDAAAQADALGRAMLLRLVQRYRQGGHRALGEYRDKRSPARIGEQFDTMLKRASALPDLLPELRTYLLQFPDARLPDADSFFYWEKVDFGLKPTIRVNHGVIHRGRADGRDYGVVAVKQLYASHYFHTALDVSVCVDDATAAGRGFYLLTLKGSQQEGLTGVKGSIVRKVVVDKTRRALESALLAIKRSIEFPR